MKIRIEHIERALCRLGLEICPQCGEWVRLEIYHKIGGKKRDICPECNEEIYS